MKWISTLLLLALALLLGAIVLFYERKQPSSEEAGSRAKRLFDLEGADVRWISVDRDGTLARFERVKPSWKMIAPVADRADAYLLDSLANKLCALESKRVLDASSPPPPDTEAGFAPPRALVRMEAGSGPIAIVVGRDAPATGALYLRVTGRKETYLVDRYIGQDLERPIQDWRDRILLDATPLDLEGARLTRPSGTLRFRRQGEDWRLAEPVDDEADGSKVQGLLAAITGLRVEAFLPSSEPPERTGLDGPMHRVSLDRRGGSQAGEILFGKPVEGNPSRLFARVPGREGIFEIPASILQELDSPADSFRSRRLFRLGEFDARGLDLESGGEKLSFSRVEGKWEASKPAGLKPRPGSIEQTLTALSGLEAETIEGPAAGLPGYGLDPPAARAEMTGEGEPGLTEALRFGRPASEGRVFAMKEGRPYIVTVSSAVLDRFRAESYE